MAHDQPRTCPRRLPSSRVPDDHASCQTRACEPRSPMRRLMRPQISGRPWEGHLDLMLAHPRGDRPGGVGAPPRADGSIGCAGSTLAWQVNCQSSHGRPAKPNRVRLIQGVPQRTGQTAAFASRVHQRAVVRNRHASRMRAWLDSMIDDRESLPYQVGETSMIDRGERCRRCGMTACTI
jgi:hypothetical protein